MRVDADFVNTFQIELLEGRDGEESDINKSVLITETTLKQLGWDDFEGQKLWDYDVIGIVNEFQYTDAQPDWTSAALCIPTDIIARF